MDGGYAPILPQDLITNIVKRLPVKSLIRFQCVCKYWKNLFRTPSFIADHLHHSTHQNPSLLALKNKPLRLRLLDCEMQTHEIEVPRLIDCLDSGRIVGSSNGLLCVEIDKYHFHGRPNPILLWNPAIREIRWVPETTIQFACDYFIGFGFSPIDDDYKIVMIYFPQFMRSQNRVKVYSSSSGSWKEVECGILEGIFISSGHITVNGEMFWFGSRLVVEDDEIILISFDMAMEVFVTMPTLHLGSIFTSNSLTVYDNKLAVLSSPGTPDLKPSLVDLWVMEEGTDASTERWSWTKKYTSGPFSEWARPVTMWRNEVVFNRVVSLIGEAKPMEFDRYGKFSLCNITTNEFKMVDIHYAYIFNYAESLVPVRGRQSFAMFM